jgi:putative molybdopterin biosynthesis protein
LRDWIPDAYFSGTMKDKFRENLPLANALSLWAERLREEGIITTLPEESIPVREALHRVTAGPVFSCQSSPAFHSSSMDGYAVRALDTFGASETSPKRLKIATGPTPDPSEGGEAVQIDTGKPMPQGFDAVLVLEEVSVEDGFIEFLAPAFPWKNVRLAGEDIVSTELILPENHKLRPMDLAALLAGGVDLVKVRRKPIVAVIPTGSDLVSPGTQLRTGEIIESNSSLLGGFIEEWGGVPLIKGIVPDEPLPLKQAVLDALGESDMVIVNAGASLGTRDYTFDCVTELGRVVLHGVAVKPGKPVISGIINDKPVVGLPGFPVSAFITMGLFVKPIVHAFLGLSPEPARTLEGKISRTAPSSLGVEEFIRVKVGKVGGEYIVTPLERGAGQLMSLVRADGILRIPAMSEGLGPGARVSVELLKDPSHIENTAVFIGSHDNAIDLLGSFLKKNYPHYSLSSAHVGSMGGLLALKRGEAHCAPTHLLDEETGEYNISFIKKLLPDKKIVLINMVYREQGLMLKKGNPKNIKGFQDLSRLDVRFINRQAGSGTRFLLDKHLKELGIAPARVHGYDREEYTHMAVASAVLTDAADCGLGVLSAARALGLDFIPVAGERYDIAIPSEFLELPQIQAVLRIMREDGEFKKALLAMGGYGVEDMGRVLFP